MNKLDDVAASTMQYRMNLMKVDMRIYNVVNNH